MAGAYVKLGTSLALLKRLGGDARFRNRMSLMGDWACEMKSAAPDTIHSVWILCISHASIVVS